MIRVQFFQDEAGRHAGFDARGHAEFGEEGPDIVCAAVSALLQTAVLGLEQCAGAHPTFAHRKGHLRCEIPARYRSSSTDVLLGSIQLGLAEIADRYPGYITIGVGSPTKGGTRVKKEGPIPGKSRLQGGSVNDRKHGTHAPSAGGG